MTCQRRFPIMMTLFALGLTACLTITPTPPAAKAPATAVSAATATASPIAAVPPTATTTASPSPSPTASPSPTTPCLAAEALTPTELQAQVPGGTTWLHAWQVRNIGACPWEPPLALAPLDTDLPGSEVPLATPIEPGQIIVLPWEWDAPAEGGDFQGRWTLRLGDGATVPITFALHLEVVPATPTPIPPTPTAGTPLYLSTTLDISPGTTVNFDDGMPEILYTRGGGFTQLLHVGDHVFFKPFYIWPLNFGDCYNAHYTKKNAIINPEQQVGMAFCFTTNERRVGALRIEDYYTGSDGKPHLVITFMTWAYKRPKW